MSRSKIAVRRDLSDIEPSKDDGWFVRTLAEMGDEAFAAAILEASEGDPFDTSTPESALSDLRDLEEWAGCAFDAGEWLAVADAEGPIGVVLPQLRADDPTTGTLFYVGVVPQRRGSGLGRRLHRFGLERLVVAGARRYHGSTDAENAPMRAVFRANGCIEQSESAAGEIG